MSPGAGLWPQLESGPVPSRAGVGGTRAGVATGRPPLDVSGVQRYLFHGRSPALSVRRQEYAVAAKGDIRAFLCRK